MPDSPGLNPPISIFYKCQVPKGGGTVTYDLPATLEGVFEAELEDRKEQIIQLTVEP